MAKAADFSVFSVLVTGSNRGIGLGLVKRFLELPSPPKWVFATTRDLEVEKSKEEKGIVMEASKSGGVTIRVCHQSYSPTEQFRGCRDHSPLPAVDVTNLVSIQAALKEVGKCVGEGGLTLLINNAGIWVYSDMETENAKDMMKVYSVNTISPLQITQAFLPLLKKAAQRSPCQGLSTSKSAIINMSSNAASIELVAYWNVGPAIAYRCSKAALNMLTKCQSLEYAANGIMSVAMHPGSVETSPNPVLEISVKESTQGIVTVLSMLSEEDNGTFLDWLGCRVPW